MTETNRYLALFDETGAWISRPDLYVYLRMSFRDDQPDEDFNQAYQYISQPAKHSNPDLNGPQALLEKQYIRGHMTERRHAAMIFCELLRLHRDHESPTLGNALKLAVYYLKTEKPNTSEASLTSQLKTAFSKWRNTSHLEAALRLSSNDIGNFENDPEKLNDFLAMSRALEMFMDEVCETGKLSWNPWRILDVIEAAYRGEVTKLSDEERRLIAAK